MKQCGHRPPELKDTLDAMTGYSCSTPAVKTLPVMVNEPENVVSEWDVVKWRRHEDNVERLRQRIFTATQEGNRATVRNLQQLDAAELEQHAYQREAGDAAQCWCPYAA